LFLLLLLLLLFYYFIYLFYLYSFSFDLTLLLPTWFGKRGRLDRGVLEQASASASISFGNNPPPKINVITRLVQNTPPYTIHYTPLTSSSTQSTLIHLPTSIIIPPLDPSIYCIINFTPLFLRSLRLSPIVLLILHHLHLCHNPSINSSCVIAPLCANSKQHSHYQNSPSFTLATNVSQEKKSIPFTPSPLAFRKQDCTILPTSYMFDTSPPSSHIAKHENTLAE